VTGFMNGGAPTLFNCHYVIRDSLISLQPALAPMMIFARREHPLDVAVQNALMTTSG
jgi:hypothetical protein